MNNNNYSKLVKCTKIKKGDTTTTGQSQCNAHPEGATVDQCSSEHACNGCVVSV